MKRSLPVALALMAFSGSGYASSGLCGAGETAWFSAAVEGSEKTVSICGSASLEGSGAWIDYRFGKPGQIELQFPPKPSGSLDVFTVRRYTRFRTTYLKLEFDNGGYNYAILEFHEVDADPEYSATLRVRRNSDGNDVASFKLIPQSEPLNIMRLENHVRTEPFDE